MEKSKILDILFWIFLIISVILLIWAVFGQSPTELYVLLPILLTLLLKIWSINDRLLRLEINVSNKLNSLEKDLKEHLKGR